MRRRMIAFVCFLVLFSFQVIGQELPHIIPNPVSIQEGNGGAFSINNNTMISTSGNPDINKVASYFAEKIKGPTGFTLKLANAVSDNSIHLVLNAQSEAQLGKEGYTLESGSGKVTIKANTTAGLFYGIQTLLQLLPKQIESKTLVKNIDWKVPSVKVTDYPRLGWRGVMLDVSRHYFNKEEVKDFIDQIARYKYNIFHWHLTDDQGWRIEIKSYPKLTQVGAWRVPRYGKWNTHAPPKPGEKATDGGFYTQGDIKEIVQYAKDRNIEIMPEIDVPGHSMAAVASYPELCVTKDTSIRVNPGSKFSTWFGNGKFEMHVDNTLNPSDEKVYQFLDKVFGEIATLFPFEYIHMGGDECYKGYWEKDAGCKALMKKLNLKNSDELQSYFGKRVSKIIIDKGKKPIGWDEILQGGLPEGSAVMSWRGMKGGIQAAKQNAPVVMSPSPMCYLDLYQGDPSVEPPTYDMARLKDSYNWDPVPEGVNSDLILGGQGNLWTEQIPTTPQIQYMAYPRAFALSELFWSPKSRKDWDNFVQRVEYHFERFDEAKLNYAMSMYDPIIKVTKNNTGKVVINLTTEVKGMDLFYTLDNTLPNQYYSLYKEPIVVPEGVDMFRVVSYKNGKRVGKMISLKSEDLVKRIKK